MNAVRVGELASEIAAGGQSKDASLAALICFGASLHALNDTTALEQLADIAKAMSARANGETEPDDEITLALQDLAREL